MKNLHLSLRESGGFLLYCIPEDTGNNCDTAKQGKGNTREEEPFERPSPLHIVARRGTEFSQANDKKDQRCNSANATDGCANRLES